MQSEFLKIRQRQRPRPVLVILAYGDDGDLGTSRWHVSDAIGVALDVWNDRPVDSVAVKFIAEMMPHRPRTPAAEPIRAHADATTDEIQSCEQGKGYRLGPRICEVSPVFCSCFPRV